MDNSFLADQRNNVDHFNYYYFNNVFSKEELEQIHKFGKASDIQPASILADTDASNPSTDFRKSNVGWIFGTSENNCLYYKISGLVKTANKNTGEESVWFCLEDFMNLEFKSWLCNCEHEYLKP